MRFSRAILLCAVLLPWLSLEAAAQRYTYRQYGSEDGLANQAINSLLQDKTGFLWVGTDDGLFRYDGSRFQQFDDSDGLPGTEILALAESPSGTLWVATMDGVAWRQPDGRFKTLPGLHSVVEGLGIDAYGRIYLRLPSALLRGEPDGNGSFRFTSIASGTIDGFYAGEQGVWFSKRGQLWQAGGDGIVEFGSRHGLPELEWRAIVQDTGGNLWVRSDRRLFELPWNGTRFIDRSASIPLATQEPRLYADSHGRLFVPSDLGATLIDGNHRMQINSRSGLPADAVDAVLLGRGESLWLGTSSGLVRRLGHGEWLSWKKEDGLSHSTIWSILGDPQSRMWIGSANGLDILDPQGKVVRSWKRQDGLSGDRVLSLVETPSGDHFAGTDPAWITRFSRDGRLLESYRESSGLPQAKVYKLALDGSQYLWAGTKNGAYRSRQPVSSKQSLTFERVLIPGSSDDLRVHDILPERGGVVWLATTSGLARFDNGRCKLFTTADGLKDDNIAVVSEVQGAIWIGYRGSKGISIIVPRGEKIEISHLTRADGLASDRIYSIAADLGGRAWVASDNGLDLIRDRRLLHHYGKEDGLIYQDTDGLALFVDKTNSVWVGTANGLSRYSPSIYPVLEAPPPVVITSIRGVSRLIRPSERPLLPYRHSALAVQFSALDFSHEGRMRFRYRLLGLDDNWIETSERSLQFAGLPAGNYLFEVTARNENGEWNPRPAQFRFTIQPPWWQSAWFLICAPLILFVLLRLFWSYRLHSLVRQKALLEKMVADRTAALAESEERYRSVYHNTLIGLYRTTPAGKVLMANPALAKMLGAETTDEVLSWDIARGNFSPGYSRDQFIKELEEKGAIIGLESSWKRLDGSTLCVRENARAVRDASGKTLYYEGAVEDISSRKRAEAEAAELQEQLTQSQKLEAIGRLAGGIAHDFNNLLMVIMAQTELLSLSLEGAAADRAAKVMKSAHRAAELTRQLLAFSRKQPIQPRVATINDLLTDMSEMVRRLVSEDIEIRIALEKEPWQVKIDRSQFEQVIMNLVVNARDAMPNGGRLALETANVIIREEEAGTRPELPAGDYAVLSVSDTGTGMSEEVQARVFEPFFTTKAQGKGTGLGLSMVYGIAKQNAGFVSLYSELGQGSCFKIYLPRVQTPDDKPEPLPPRPQKQPEKKGATILLVEDEINLRSVVAEYLKAGGHSVIEAGTLDDACELAAANRSAIDLLLTDVILKGGNARQLVDRLIAQGGNFPVIYMSGYTPGAIVDHGILQTGTLFLQKPFGRTKLFEKVNEALEIQN
jgi:PAS domain S-box-containing protein